MLGWIKSDRPKQSFRKHIEPFGFREGFIVMTNRGCKDIAFPIFVRPNACLELTITHPFSLPQDGGSVEELD